MTTIGQPERFTQNRVIALFRDELLIATSGDWTDRAHNSNTEEGLLTDFLRKNATPRHKSAALACTQHHPAAGPAWN